MGPCCLPPVARTPAWRFGSALFAPDTPLCLERAKARGAEAQGQWRACRSVWAVPSSSCTACRFNHSS